MKVGGIGVPEFIIALCICGVCAFFTYRIAAKKGYDSSGYAALGFFLTIIGLIIAACLPDRRKKMQADTADALVKYKQLLDQGVITQEEFEAKKKELL